MFWGVQNVYTKVIHEVTLSSGLLSSQTPLLVIFIK